MALLVVGDTISDHIILGQLGPNSTRACDFWL